MSEHENKYQVYIYLKECFIDVPAREGDTCEDLCTSLCQRYDIGPLVQLLVGLRIHDEPWFLAPSARPQAGKKYDFRVRFKIPKLSNMKTLDRALFNYYYYQLRHDLLQSKIGEIENDEYKNKILGYVVNDMYRKMVEDKVSVTELQRTYKEYIPRKISKEHSFLFFNLARTKVLDSLKQICRKDHDVDYVKSVYINDIDNIAPCYLYEEYDCSIPYPRDDGITKPGKCKVKVKFVPYAGRSRTVGKNAQKDDSESLPGLKVLYSQEWRHVANIDEIFTILVDKQLTVDISLKDQPNLYSIDFSSQTELESFVTCLAGYYRLMCKWTVYLCKPHLSSPTLNRLTELKCHGPIGGKYSYRKIAEKNSSVGANIVRQCENHYDTYYVDILERENQMKTYKLTYAENRWHVHRGPSEVTAYDELLDALRNLNPKIKNLYRLSPTEHDKAPNLLLCQPENDMTSKKLLRDAGEMQQVRPQIVNAAKELAIKRNALKNEGDGFFEKTRAELFLPNNTKMEVTLKLLKNDKKDEHLSDFLQLADFWASIDCRNIIKLYGVTLFKPVAMVLESSRDSPLDEFLRQHRKITFSSLIDVAHSLACALYYLQEKGLVHGRIRCSSMLVTAYERSENRLIGKLGDPGLRQQHQYTEQDLLWIPIEYHDLGQSDVQLLKRDLRADIWACSTTLWEIFSRGKGLTPRNVKQFIASGRRLEAPAECKHIKEIYQCMFYGWAVDPDKRFAPQMIISKLVQAKQRKHYCEIPQTGILNGTTNSANGSYSHQSINSFETDSTLLNSRTDVSNSSYVSNGSDGDAGSNASSECSSQPLISNGGSSHYSTGSHSGWGQAQAENFLYDCPDFIELSNGSKVIFQGELGQGHYGKVYCGCIDDGVNQIQVALKTIYPISPLDAEIAKTDFKREVSIMKKLNHRNIVKLIDFIDEIDKLVVIMEFMEKGSLLDFVSYNRHNLTKLNLLRFSKDIANGMNHLFEKKIIHRDLAARNILVQSMDCVKISDFGLAQVTDGGNYYVAQNNRDLPIKWYSPETLKTMKYSFKSDVWSFGVTLFEMFTYGETPFPELEIRDAGQLFDLLTIQRIRLQLTDQDRDVQEQLMDPCFILDSHQRPSFVQLFENIEQLIDQYGESIQLF